ncbi:MAG: 50S ribosomal protein L25 [Bdellovibrionales bacterium]|nr:50S ribosomal protein L25 [Bdellovibrionales bacterium]
MTNQSNIEITAHPRSTGKGSSRSLRKDRMIPAIVYGPSVKNIVFCLSQNDAVKYSSHRYENSVITLKSDDKNINGIQVLMKSHDFHPKTHVPTHIDFYAPDMKQVVRVNVELVFQGKPKGAAEGGVFNAIKRDLEIECLPTEIPENIIVDVTPVDLNGSLHVADLKIPAHLKVLTPGDQTVCTVAVVEEVSETPAAESEAGTEATPATPEKK